MPKKTLPAKPKQNARKAATARQLYVYRITIQPDDGRYYVEVPALPGCYSWGFTYEEALQNAKQAIEVWLEVKKEAGESIPIEEIPRQSSNSWMGRSGVRRTSNDSV